AHAGNATARASHRRSCDAAGRTGRTNRPGRADRAHRPRPRRTPPAATRPELPELLPVPARAGTRTCARTTRADDALHRPTRRRLDLQARLRARCTLATRTGVAAHRRACATPVGPGRCARR